jgi:aspartate dehydrogenase
MPVACIGLIGLGAVGREVTARLRAEGSPIEVIGLVRRAIADANVDRLVKRTADLIAARPDLVVEAAGHGAVAEHVVPILEAGIPVVLASVGALADDRLRHRVMKAAQIGRTNLTFPGGAVGALDYIRAVSQVPNLRIRYCSRKPIAAWEQELVARGLAPDALNGEVTLFEGTAREAALAFPQNLNVAMSLALAGPGIEGVEVRVVADPRATGNTHEIEIESAAGRAALIFNNTPSARNPKTSALTALSIVCAVREHLDVLSAAREPAP